MKNINHPLISVYDFIFEMKSDRIIFLIMNLCDYSQTEQENLQIRIHTVYKVQISHSDNELEKVPKKDYIQMFN